MRENAAYSLLFYIIVRTLALGACLFSSVSQSTTLSIPSSLYPSIGIALHPVPIPGPQRTAPTDSFPLSGQNLTQHLLGRRIGITFHSSQMITPNVSGHRQSPSGQKSNEFNTLVPVQSLSLTCVVFCVYYWHALQITLLLWACVACWPHRPVSIFHY